MVSALTAGMVSGTTSPPSGARPSSNTSEKFEGVIPPRVDIQRIVLVLADQIADLDDFVTARANAHTRNTHPGQLFEGLDVLLGVVGQILQAASAGNVFVPAREVFINGFGVVEVGLGHRHGIVADTVDIVGDAHRNLVNAGEHIEFGNEVIGEPVDHRSMTGHDGVIPAGAAWTSGVDTKFATGGAQLVAHFVEEFGREWSGPYPGGIGLDDADGTGESGWADAGTNRGATGGWVR